MTHRSTTNPNCFWFFPLNQLNIIQIHNNVLQDWQYSVEYIFLTFRLNVRNILATKYCQSCRTLLWIWIMLWRWYGLGWLIYNWMRIWTMLSSNSSNSTWPHLTNSIHLSLGVGPGATVPLHSNPWQFESKMQSNFFLLNDSQEWKSVCAQFILRDSHSLKY